MDKLDPRLRYLRQVQPTELPSLEGTERFALSAAAPPEPEVSVLVGFRGSVSELAGAGLRIDTVAGDVVSGRATLGSLDAIAAVEGVDRLESSRPLSEELDLALADTGADAVHTGPPGARGSGVIVGVIDSGIDFRHPNFQRGDGTTRILAIWDQSLSATGGESSPAGFSYGVEYTKSDIDGALANPPTAVVRHVAGNHGTHVAGIAAGNGAAPDGSQPAFTLVGVAPEADIIAVRNATQTQALGDSARTLDAVSYIFQKAASLGKPAVVNLSQGDNLGPHDGTSLLERGIDNLLGGQGRAMVKSAGNAANDDIHASGTVTAGDTETVRFVVPANDTAPDTIDIWYDGPDRFDFVITPPGGVASAVVSPGTTTTLFLANGNRVFVDSVLNDPNNNDNRIYVQLEPGPGGGAIQSGTWSFGLTGTSVGAGRFDAWIERGQIIPRFIGTHRDPLRTISVPGTAQEIITAASYITRGSGVGGISVFSSQGPTRDGRAAPTLAAPGEWINSTVPGGGYGQSRGTSMSAPHITGAIALMFQRNPNLTQSEIRDCLTSTARSDAFTGAVPNTTWGAGKIDVEAAFDCVQGALPPVTRPPDPRCIRTRPPDPRCIRTRPPDPRCIRTRPTDPRCVITRPMDPRCVITRPADPRCGLTRPPRCVLTRPTDPRCGITRPTDPRCGFTRPTDPRCGFTRPADPRCGFTRPTDPRCGFTRSPNPRCGFTRPTDPRCQLITRPPDPRCPTPRTRLPACPVPATRPPACPIPLTRPPRCPFPVTRSPACLGRPSLFDAGEGHEFDAYAVEDFDEGTWIEGDPYADDASAWDVGDADEDWEYCYADPYGEWEDY